MAGKDLVPSPMFIEIVRMALTQYLTQSSAARAPILVSAADEAVLAGLGLSSLAGGDESKLNNTEVGAKWTLLDGTMQLEVVYAHARWSEAVSYTHLTLPTN